MTKSILRPSRSPHNLAYNVCSVVPQLMFLGTVSLSSHWWRKGIAVARVAPGRGPLTAAAFARGGGVSVFISEKSVAAGGSLSMAR